MAQKRINPETGELEEKGLFGWGASRNEDGNRERINLETGEHEEKGLFGWRASRNEDGHRERVNTETGEHEEKSIFGWGAQRNEDGRRERVNIETGEHEEKSIFGWGAKRNEDGHRARVNTESGIHEEKGIFGWSATRDGGHDWRGTPRGRSDEESAGFSPDAGRTAEVSTSSDSESYEPSSSSRTYISSSSSSAGDGGGTFAVILVVVVLGALGVAGLGKVLSNSPAASVPVAQPVRTPAPQPQHPVVYLFQDTGLIGAPTSTPRLPETQSPVEPVCRQYQSTVTVAGREQAMEGTACRQSEITVNALGSTLCISIADVSISRRIASKR